MISIVIPNYNGESYLKDCIDSIKRQEGSDYEIIIIDNASIDSDYKWIKEDVAICWVQLDQNYGFSKAVNEGIKLSKGAYVLLLNNDTILEQYFLVEIKKAIEEDEKIFSISSKMIRANERHLIDDAGDMYNLLGWARKRGDGQSVEKFTKPCEVFSACAGAALYRRHIFEEIGYFDERFFAYMEDVDIGYRARLHGYVNKYCPTAHVYHIGSATSGSRHNEFKVRLAARNNLYMLRKNMSRVEFTLKSPFILIGCLIKFGYFTLKGYGKAYREGIKEGIYTI